MGDDGFFEAETILAPECDQYAWGAVESYPPTGPEPVFADNHPWPRRIAWSTVVLIFGAATGSAVWVADRFGGEGAYVTTPVLQPTTTTEPPAPPLLSPPATETETMPPVTETVTPQQTYVPPETYVPPVQLPPQTVTVAPPPPPPPQVVYMWLHLPFMEIPIPLPPPPPPPPAP